MYKHLITKFLIKFGYDTMYKFNDVCFFVLIGDKILTFCTVDFKILENVDILDFLKNRINGTL